MGVPDTGTYEAQELFGHNHPAKSAGDVVGGLPAAVQGTHVYYAPEPAVAPERGPSAEADVAEEVRETWLRGAMDAMQAGREIPVRDLPRDLLGDAALVSAEATSQLYRQASTKRFVVSIDIAALERARAAKLAAIQADAMRAADAAATRWLADVLQRTPDRSGERKPAVKPARKRAGSKGKGSKGKP